MYLPYWRYKGVVFARTPSGVRSRVLDNTFLAADETLLPLSMGIRPQVCRLHFLATGSRGHFLKPRIDLGQALAAMEGQWKTLGDSTSAGESSRRDYIGETASLLFYPLSIRQGFAVDGLSREPIRRLADGEAEALLSDRSEPPGSMKFLPAICPECGWDFLGEGESMVLFCRNCQGGWQPSLEGFRRIPLVCASGEGEKVHYLPFWMIRARMTGTAPSPSRGPGATVNGGDVRDGAREFVFWLPAFKVHPDLFLRLARKMTLEPFDGGLSAPFPAQPVAAATLPAEEAREAIPAAAAHMASERRSSQGVLPAASWESTGTQLALLPFRALGSEFIQTRMNLGIPQNAVRYGIHL